ncbi:hypothetical protein [Streptomyces sp. UH6]|uniref:hypothetical protein n=1 Tax=Streptomyces sp. UH6 TaxID=2748379 RepID=UPI0015D4BCCA|nr:hypothetical protein [Streptomyces sp. UH6]NYV74526.1 hypothetical protein [Streptomyces sp. UH6]
MAVGTSVDKEQVRLLMEVRHPLTGELLVAPKVRRCPRGKLQAHVLAEAHAGTGGEH